jgi:hypothetical protein
MLSKEASDLCAVCANLGASPGTTLMGIRIKIEVFLHERSNIFVEIRLIFVKAPCDARHGLPVVVREDVPFSGVVPK